MLRRTAIAILPVLLAGLVGLQTEASAANPRPLPMASKWEPWGMTVNGELPQRLKKYGDLYRAKARISPDGTDLLVTYRLRDAAKLPGSSDAFQVAFTSITRGKSHYTFGVFTAEPGKPFADVFTEGDEQTSGGKIECRGYRVRVDYAANILRKRIPLRCFGSPARVRLGASVAVAFQPAGNGIYDISIGQDLARFGPVLL